MKLFKIAAVTLLSLAFYACVPLGEHCPDEGGEITVNPCSVRPDAGPCEAKITKYYYDEATGKCTEFEWGGCQGTVPFHSLKECTECAGTTQEEPTNSNINVLGSFN